MSNTTQIIDQAKLDEFMGQFVGDLGAALSAALVVIGDKLGLYRAMADGDLMTAEELSSRTGTDARYVREWLSNQAAGGYVGYDSAAERFFRPGYAANLEAYPRSAFVGFDYHQASIEHARSAAAQAGLDGRISFEVATAKQYAGEGYDLVMMFDCLHDMGDPVGAAAHVRQTLTRDGAWMIVEPFAGDRLEDNLNPVGRVFYGASTLVCTPASRDQEVGLALGAQAGEARLREVVNEGGFTRVRRATETPFNIVLEARP